MSSIVKYQPAQLKNIADFITRLNRLPEHHIGYFSTDMRSIERALQNFYPSPEQCVRVAIENNQLIGALGVDTDPDLGRAWFYGPFVEQSLWHATAEKLYDELVAELPMNITEYELFGDIRNTQLLKFAVRHEFELVSTQHVLLLKRENFSQSEEINVQQLAPEFFDQFEQLHDHIFPRTYFSAQEILTQLNQYNQVFILTEGATLLGYVYGTIEADTGEATLEFLAVAESERGKGYGKVLVQVMAGWVFSQPQVQVIRLTVDAENKPAFATYRSSGFALERALLAYRKNTAEE